MTKENLVPEIQIGICSGEQISFTLNGKFQDNSGDFAYSGKCIAGYSDKKLFFRNEERDMECEETLLLRPLNDEKASFTLHGVTIGVDFHWQRSEDQVFKGKLKLIIEDDKITAVNVLSVELNMIISELD